jgi:hypothetical protein
MCNLRGWNGSSIGPPHAFDLSINVRVQFHLIEVTSNNGGRVIQGIYFITDYALGLHISAGNLSGSNKNMSREMKSVTGRSVATLTYASCDGLMDG